MPSLIAKHQKQQTVVKLKKAVLTIQQAIVRGQADAGSVDIVVQGGINLSTPEGEELYSNMRNEFVENYIMPYINILKDCGEKNSNKCPHYVQTSIDKQSFVLPINSNGRSFITNDGTFYYVSGDNGVVIDDDGNRADYSVARFLIYVDINGLKGPNIQGRDVFLMQVDPKGNVTMFGKGKSREELKTHTYWGCNSKTSRRFYCGALIQQDGWQIKDDYLW